MRCAMRPMRIEDVPQANEIDRECFPAQWPLPSYKKDILFGRPTHYLVACEERANNAVEQTKQSEPMLSQLLRKLRRPFYTAEASASNQRIIGLVGLWIMAGEAHITTIGVREAYRRRGIGELLLISVMELAFMRHAQLVTLEVRSSNSAAQALYEKYGFTKAGVRQGYYTDNREDALIMTTDTMVSDSFQSRFQRQKKAHAERWGIDQHQINI